VRPGEQQGVRDHGQAVQGLVPRSTTRTRRLKTSSRFTSGRPPIADWANGQKRLHGLHEVEAGLDESELGRHVGARHRLGGALWRRSWLKGSRSPSPDGRVSRRVRRGASRAVHLRVLTVDSFTGLRFTTGAQHFRELWHRAASTKRRAADDPIAAPVRCRTRSSRSLAYFMGALRRRASRCAVVLCSCRSGRRYLDASRWQLILSSKRHPNWSLHKLGLGSAEPALHEHCDVDRVSYTGSRS